MWAFLLLRYRTSWRLFQSPPWIVFFLHVLISHIVTFLLAVTMSYCSVSLLGNIYHMIHLTAEWLRDTLSLFTPPIPNTSSFKQWSWKKELDACPCCYFSWMESNCSGSFFNASWHFSVKDIVYHFFSSWTSSYQDYFSIVVFVFPSLKCSLFCNILYYKFSKALLFIAGKTVRHAIYNLPLSRHLASF